MPRLFRRLLLASALASLAGPLAASPAVAAGIDGLRAVAQREGLLVTGVRPDGVARVIVRCGGNQDREAFLRRASLVAYAAFAAKPATREVAFELYDRGMRQSCRVQAADLQAFLADRIGKQEYQRRLAYRIDPEPRATVPLAPRGAATLLPPPPRVPGMASLAPELPPAPAARPLHPLPLPPLPQAGGQDASAGAPALPAPGPAIALPTLPTLEGTWGFGYGLALGKGGYDAYQLEYGHPLLPTLDLRPSVWMMSAFSPMNRLATAGPAFEGVSAAVDLIGTTRRQVGPGGLALEGGLGLRTATLQNLAGPGLWPAMHLRVGARWQMLGLAVRYPLLARPGDPTGTWEASAGLNWSFGGASGR